MLNTENKKQKVVKYFLGKVVGLIDEKTIKVSTSRSVFMSTPGKMVYIRKNIICHSDSSVKVGDVVKILQCKPISKLKKFLVTK